MEIKTFSSGQEIFAEGDRSDYAYIIEYGNVVIYREIGDRQVRLAVLGKGEIFGEMGLIDDRPRSASARASNDIALSPVDNEKFLDLLHNDPAATIPIITLLFERLRMMNDRYVEALGHIEDSGPAADNYNVKLLPLSPETTRAISTNGLNISVFPFRVGRAQSATQNNPLHWNDLSFPDTAPYNLSLNHFMVERGPAGLAIRDRGSHFGTIVNGKQIGGIEPDNTVPLIVGTNEVIAGKPDSPFRFRLIVEPLEA
ncbi:MAG: cyclic nucleotide-binding domain-containing protein [Alphaproteobacteria bacterium]|jgi:CRP-like cAMP-binding protein|nr:cyclic nucleotide-binding domain-containing protein [Alphaproteobacteria bacterium]MDP6517690.1 cyclic nucleotide-binding domain-containing protein [Alphaproteobacteria bacterium]